MRLLINGGLLKGRKLLVDGSLRRDLGLGLKKNGSLLTRRRVLVVWGLHRDPRLGLRDLGLGLGLLVNGALGKGRVLRINGALLRNLRLELLVQWSLLRDQGLLVNESLLEGRGLRVDRNMHRDLGLGLLIQMGLLDGWGLLVGGGSSLDMLGLGLLVEGRLLHRLLLRLLVERSLLLGLEWLVRNLLQHLGLGVVVNCRMLNSLGFRIEVRSLRQGLGLGLLIGRDLLRRLDVLMHGDLLLLNLMVWVNLLHVGLCLLRRDLLHRNRLCLLIRSWPHHLGFCVLVKRDLLSMPSVLEQRTLVRSLLHRRSENGKLHRRLRCICLQSFRCKRIHAEVVYLFESEATILSEWHL
jgi:hypothetical protein